MAFISNGTTILDAGAFSVGLGSQILLSTGTASGASSIEFTSGIDSTYDVYQFEFIDIHAATDAADFGFLTSTNSGSSYGVTTTNTVFRAYHYEDGSESGLDYLTSFDIAQGTSLNFMSLNQGNNNDDSAVGKLYLFAPSSTTYVKHFMYVGNNSHQLSVPLNVHNFLAGYVNSTSAVDAIQFKFNTGNIDAGTIKMYGIKGS